MQGELGSKHWGNRLPGSGGTAGPGHQNGFLIKESENPFRQAWLGKYPIAGWVWAISCIARITSVLDWFMLPGQTGRGLVKLCLTSRDNQSCALFHAVRST
jgi:hypothetical protein